MHVKDICPVNEEGSPHGYWESHTDNGQLIYKATYVNGDMHGWAEFFHINTGTLNAKGTFKDDRKVGFWIWYREDGTVKLSILYADE